MTRPAGRGHDQDMCPKHTSGEQNPDNHDVRVNGKPLVYATSTVACAGCNDFIVTGSGTVNVASKPAARALDRTMHGGAIMIGSGNVNVGGPNVGASLGYSGAAEAACEALARSRRSRSTHQSFGNCGIESSRLIINKVRGANHSEREIFGHAAIRNYTAVANAGDDKKGHYLQLVVIRRDANGDVVVDQVVEVRPDGSNSNGDASGGISPSNQSKLLDDYGVSAETVDQTMDNVVQAVADGKGVITWNKAGTLWGTNDPGTHAVNVTGVTYDANGNLKSVVTADTGLGKCCKEVPAKQFESSFYVPPVPKGEAPRPAKIAMTKERVWP